MDARKWLEIGYAEARVEELKTKAKQKKEQPEIELNEVEEGSPMLMMSRAYEALNSQQKTNETIKTLGATPDEDPETAQAKEYLNTLRQLEAEYLEKIDK